jgi:hypothetical protein
VTFGHQRLRSCTVCSEITLRDPEKRLCVAPPVSLALQRVPESSSGTNLSQGSPRFVPFLVFERQPCEQIRPATDVAVHLLQKPVEGFIGIVIADVVEFLYQVAKAQRLPEHVADGSADFDEHFVVRFCGVLRQGSASLVVVFRKKLYTLYHKILNKAIAQ